MSDGLYCCKCNKEIKDKSDDYYFGNPEEERCKHYHLKCFKEVQKYREREKLIEGCLKDEQMKKEKMETAIKKQMKKFKGQTVLGEFG